MKIRELVGERCAWLSEPLTRSAGLWRSLDLRLSSCDALLVGNSFGDMCILPRPSASDISCETIKVAQSTRAQDSRLLSESRAERDILELKSSNVRRESRDYAGHFPWPTPGPSGANSSSL